MRMGGRDGEGYIRPITEGLSEKVTFKRHLKVKRKQPFNLLGEKHIPGRMVNSTEIMVWKRTCISHWDCNWTLVSNGGNGMRRASDLDIFDVELNTVKSYVNKELV